MNKSLKEKIHAFLAGTAVGDALGLGTEFMTRSEVIRHYGDGLRDYADIVRDSHRRQWKRGDWTNDTDVVLLLAESLIASNGYDSADYARRLQEWQKELPADLGSNIRWVLTQPDYLENPTAVSQRTWEKIGHFEASNEALGRAALLAFWPGTRDEIVENAIDNCKLTHYDDRCWGTCAIIAAAAHILIWEERLPTFEELKEIGMRHNPEIIPYLRTAWEGDLEDIRLDDEDTYWYTRKAMAAALWTLWHIESPEEVLHILVDAGGDADTNASLGLALSGIRHGLDALPSNLIDGLLKKERLFECAGRLTQAVEAAERAR